MKIAITLIAIFSALSTIFMIGVPRRPVSKYDALLQVLLASVVIFAVWQI